MSNAFLHTLRDEALRIEVGPDHQMLDARAVPLAKPGLHGAQPLFPARGDDDVEPFGGEHLGECLTDAGGPTRDERDAFHALFGATACCTLKIPAANAAPMQGPMMYSQTCAIDP